MKLGGNTILVTGGASGIGLAFVERFIQAGSTVIICGRRADKLDEAKQKFPELITRVCDIAKPQERIEFVQWLTTNHPSLNVVVHNAGVQRYINFIDHEEWEDTHQEIAINLEAPIHMTRLLIPHMLKVENPVFINVTSGLAWSPLAVCPIYSATKAAMHSITVSLRHQLAGSPIEVIEVAPPAVDTDLGGPGLHKFGVTITELMEYVFPKLEAGEKEIAYGFAQKSSQASRAEVDGMFAAMNQATREKFDALVKQ